MESVEVGTHWRSCRFLKATADDISRAPHALEYVLDYRLGTPGLKVFRTLTVRSQGGVASILPGIDAPARPIDFAHPTHPSLASLRDGDVAIVFAYVEPWSRSWVIVDVEQTNAAECFAHAATWADFQAELRERPTLGHADFGALRNALVAAGLDPPQTHDIVAHIPSRMLNRPARALVRWLRYRV